MGAYDYSLPGLYFVTICTANKRALFSRIVGAHHDAPVENLLTPYGQFVKESIENLPNRFNLGIENYVIMPDHIHLLIELADYERYERALREAPLQETKRSLLAQCIGYLKADVSKKIHKTEPNLKVWQGRFYDHVIRSDADYSKHFDYIVDNPVMWVENRHEI